MKSRARRRAAFNPPRTIGEQYARKLRAVVDRIQSIVMLIMREHFDALPPIPFGRIEIRVANAVEDATNDKAIRAVGARIERETANQFRRFVSGAGANRKRILERMQLKPDRTLVHKFVDQNVQLIKSLATQPVNEVRDLVERAVAAGRPPRELSREIEERFDVARSRANLIARDQTLKFHGELVKTKQRNAGITRYVWTTSNDERVREYHEDLDGTEQSWDSPPKVSADGRTAHPGEDFQCRCIAFPVIEFGDEG